MLQTFVRVAIPAEEKDIILKRFSRFATNTCYFYSYYFYLIAMGNTLSLPQLFKDGTAQGVAKVRHYESLIPPEQRLYHDPYAESMYDGSIVQSIMGSTNIDRVYGLFGMTGIYEVVSVRTKWLDEEIMLGTKPELSAKQLIILGAGYDTRGFRLDFPDEFVVYEVDQPEVQVKKLAKLNRVQQKEEDGRIASRMNSKVQFVSVNFNQDSLQEQLKSHAGFQTNQPTIVTLEGVSQYIPKSSTAQTLKDIKDIVAPGSILLITYVDQSVLENPDWVSRTIMAMSHLAGEPWISGFSPTEFADFLQECGYQVVSDTTIYDCNSKYLEPVQRKLADKHLFLMERFVVAKVL